MLACKKCLINMRTVWYKANDKIEKEKKREEKKPIKCILWTFNWSLSNTHTPEKSTWSQPCLKMDVSAF